METGAKMTTHPRKCYKRGFKTWPKPGRQFFSLSKTLVWDHLATFKPVPGCHPKKGGLLITRLYYDRIHKNYIKLC